MREWEYSSSSGRIPSGLPVRILPGRDRVHEHPARPEVDRDLVHEVDHAALARRVGDVVRRADHPVLRGDDHDPAANLVDRLLLDHLRDGPFRAEEDPAQVDGHDRVPVLLRRLQQALRPAARDPGVAHHHVEPALALDRSPDEAVDVVGARGVRAQEGAAVAEQLCDRLAALPRLLAEVADDDECAFVGEAERDRPAEARSARPSRPRTVPRAVLAIGTAYVRCPARSGR